MIHVEDVKGIIKLVVQSPIQDFSLEYESVKLSFRKESGSRAEVMSLDSSVNVDVQQRIPFQSVPEGVESPTSEEATPTLQKVISPMVGIFYASPDPSAVPYVQVGDRITEDSVVGVVEAMKLFTDIQAEMAGEIAEILVENGQLVEFGQPLFLVRSF